jgi:small conductance mechanosensitive channel
MIRFLAFLGLLLLAGMASAGQAYAQLSAVEAAAAAQKPPQPAPHQPDPAKVKELIQTLNDPVARGKLIDQLSLLTQQQAAEKPAQTDPVGSRVLKFLSGQVAEAGIEFGALGRAFIGLPAAERWFERQLSSTVTRARWAELAISLAAVLAAGGAAFALAYLAIRGPRRTIEKRRTTGAVGRFAMSLLRLVLRLMPIALFGFVGYSLLSIINPPAIVSLATLTIINATLLVLAVIAVSRFLFAPRVRGLRLIRVGDKPAAFLHHWISWLGAIIAFGWFGISALQLLGLPRVAAHGALKLVGLAVVVILISLVIRRRKDVAAWIRGDDSKSDSGKIGAVAFWSTRRRLAEVWHLLAIAYLVAIFAIWALDLEGGFDFVLHGTLISIVVIAGARIFVLAAERAMARLASFSNDERILHPRLYQRADSYLPIIRASVSVIIWPAAMIALADVWGLDTVSWMDSVNGRAAIGRIVSITFVLVSALIAWEFVSAIIETYLVGAVRDGTPIERSQRVRTLLPLLRNAFLIFLIVVVILIVLSEVGLNIAPLLAGAGVVGLAIGFGAQTLVKDVITGVFILFENTIAVGDVVDVGSGHSGLVEHFSLRTIKLRDSSGGVHTIPFSAVTSVNNMTKDFAYYVFNIKVDYAQDTDRVVEVVRELGKELQNDMSFCELILAPIEIIGLDSFGADAAILQARFKTKPIKQWTVGREFNRRLKKRFDELKIPLNFPQSMVMLPGGTRIRGEADLNGLPPDTPAVPDSAKA